MGVASGNLSNSKGFVFAVDTIHLYGIVIAVETFAKGGSMGRTPPGQTRERVFRYVVERLLGGEPPTVREVRDAFGFRSVQTAREHLETLVGEGRLAKDGGKARGYRLPVARADRPTVRVPLLGRVPAGPTEVAIEDHQGQVPVQSRYAADELFALTVRGDSMIDAGILPGDVVVVRWQPKATSGDIVVAMIEDEATVKRFRVRRGRPELHAENPAYAPIVPEPSRLSILGRVVEVRRRLD